MTNLLHNPSFEGGWWHPSEIPELQIPNLWGFWCADEAVTNPINPSPDGRFVRPEVRVLPREQLPEWERDLFLLDGDYCLKPFKGHGAILFVFYQVVDGLEVGVEYNFIVRFYPDVVERYEDDQKVFSGDPAAVCIKFAVDNTPGGDWAAINPAQDTPVVQRSLTAEHRFVAASVRAKVEVRFMLPFPLLQNGLFCDKWELRPVLEPEPTPEPVGGSLLGMHSINVASPNADTLELLRYWRDSGGRPAAVKGVSDLGWLREARDVVGPDVPIIARITSPLEGCGGVEDPGASLGVMAWDLMSIIFDKIRHDPWLAEVVTFWEVCNEPDPPGAFGYAQLGRLMIECMDIAEDYDLRLLLFSLNVGTPEWDEMIELCNTGVFARAQAGGHALALHEGVLDGQDIDHWWDIHNVDENGGPTTEETGQTAPGGWIPGAPVRRRYGSLNFRYRFLLELIEQRGEGVDIYVTEFRMNGAGDPQATEEIRRRFAWYDEEARRDPRLRAVLPFTLGAPTDGQWWPNSDYGRDFVSLIDYAVSVEGEPPVVEPPPPDDCDCKGKPREQYARTYAVLPADIDETAFKGMAWKLWRESRITVGGSYDDAGIGDLHDKTALLYGIPAERRHEYLAFYALHYPYTTVEFRDFPGEQPPPSPLRELIFPHIQDGLDHAGGYIRAVKPGFVKLVNNFEIAPQIKAWSPETQVLARFHFDDYAQFINASDKRASAERFLDAFWGALMQNKEHIDWIEGLNETIAGGLPETTVNSVAFAVELFRALAARNAQHGTDFRLCALNAAVGNPAGGEFDLLLPAAQAAAGYGGALGYHAYWPVPGETVESNCYRWMAWDRVFGDVKPQYILTEAGAVGWVGGDWDQFAGWRACYAAWDDYLEDLLAFRNNAALWNLVNENRCLGISLFTNCSWDWQSFNYTRIEWDKLAGVLGG